ncbi:MAG TPA: hypothetical protein VKA85_04055 [Candidatus Limnocylindrales bacterium]|nr:hypothetical protein [Candidatus Limnocylindrales bacterium]
MAMVAAIATTIAGCAGSPHTASPVLIATPAATTRIAATAPVASASVGPSSIGVTTLGPSGSGAFGPGTYAPVFEPSLTFLLVEQTVVAPDGTIAYESIGADDANTPGWVSISFGFDKPGRHGHGTWSGDFTIDRLDKVFDPLHPGTVIDPPTDLATWLTKLPGVTTEGPPKAVKVGGRPATQLNLVGGDTDVTIGPIPGVDDPPAFGFGAHQRARIVVVEVDGHDVLIVLGGADSRAHHARVVAALQPLVDSIVWR